MTTALPEGTVAVFHTLCGATVALTKLTPTTYLRFDHGWRCMGCGDGIAPDTQSRARQGANTHAGTCRSAPLPTTD